MSLYDQKKLRVGTRKILVSVIIYSQTNKQFNFQLNKFDKPNLSHYLS